MKVLLLAALLVLPLAGCFGSPDDDAAGPAGPSMPPATIPEGFTGLEPVDSPKLNGSEGSFIDGTRLYLSGGDGLRILDITDPAHALVLASDIPGTQGSSDVDVMHHPNGHTYAVLNVGGDGHVALLDVTDPAAAEVVSETQLCAHAIGVVPNSTVVYVSWSLCHLILAGTQPIDGDIEILDFADPAHPVSSLFVFPPFVLMGLTPHPITATSCHEISFNAVLQRAYCAGITDTQVWDVSDPLAPVVVSVIDDPRVNIHHGAWDARNGTLLILGDEMAGVLAPTPMCSDDVEYPTSALWFYDISDLAMPRALGFYQIPYDSLAASQEAGRPQYCSTHMGEVIDDNRFVIGWYTAGTALVDFTEASDPTTLATWRAQDSNVWEARYARGHIFLADTHRGLDILQFVDDL
ncbi:MAG TPA: hypothetical protein VM327_05370 [Candidatus Thermoplasmatota archaeon]|nr:hypothetical protein [Candidatus Thermoplasmatota archaeon]